MLAWLCYTYYVKIVCFVCFAEKYIYYYFRLSFPYACAKKWHNSDFMPIFLYYLLPVLRSAGAPQPSREPFQDGQKSMNREIGLNN